MIPETPESISQEAAFDLSISQDGTPLRSIVGGTGMAITQHCQSMDTAVDFTRYCASAEIQSGLYTYADGQPARREAWTNPELDAFNGHFFSGSFRSHEDG